MTTDEAMEVERRTTLDDATSLRNTGRNEETNEVGWRMLRAVRFVCCLRLLFREQRTRRWSTSSLRQLRLHSAAVGSILSPSLSLLLLDCSRRLITRTELNESSRLAPAAPSVCLLWRSWHSLCVMADLPLHIAREHILVELCERHGCNCIGDFE